MSDPKTTYIDAVKQTAAQIQSTTSDIKKDIVKYIDRGIFNLKSSYNLYDIIEQSISEIDNANIKKKYTAKYLLKNNCKPKQKNPLKLDYINSTIFKYLLKAEIDDIDRDKKNLKKLQNTLTQVGSINVSTISDVTSSLNKTINKLRDEIANQKRVLKPDIDANTITIDKEYLLTVIKRIIESFDIFSLTHEHEQRESTIKLYSTIQIIITLTTITVSAISAGTGIGAIGILSLIIGFGSKIPMNITKLGILRNDAQFIRDKYINDRFNIDSVGSISGQSYIKIQQIDEKILNLCNTFNNQKDNRQELIQSVLISINDLYKHIEKVEKDGISTFSFPTTKDKEAKQIVVLKQIKKYFDKYDEYIKDEKSEEKDKKKVNYVLIDYYNYISDKKERVEITEDIANTIKKYNDITATSKELDPRNSIDSLYINSIKNTVLVLLEKYLMLTDTSFLRNKVDKKTEILNRKIDKIYNITEPKIIKEIFEKLLLIMKIESSILSNVYSNDIIENIGYLCRKIKRVYNEKQQKAIGEHNENINIIKKMFEEFKEKIESIKEDQTIEIDNMCIELNYKEPLSAKDAEKSAIELAKIKKIDAAEFAETLGNLTAESDDSSDEVEIVPTSRTLKRTKAVHETTKQQQDRKTREQTERTKARQQHQENLEKIKRMSLIKTFLDKMTLIFTVYNNALDEDEYEQGKKVDEIKRILKLVGSRLGEESSTDPEYNEQLKKFFAGADPYESTQNTENATLNNNLYIANTGIFNTEV